MVSRIAMIIVPLIMLPNRRTDSASVREKLADDVERQHDDRRLDVGLQVATNALIHDAEKRHCHEHARCASATVVESEPVGGS